jgi:hypothetical protein
VRALAAEWRLQEQRRRREEIRTEILVRQLKAFEEMDWLDRYLATMAAYPKGKEPPRSVQAALAGSDSGNNKFAVQFDLAKCIGKRTHNSALRNCRNPPRDPHWH